MLTTRKNKELLLDSNVSMKSNKPDVVGGRHDPISYGCLGRILKMKITVDAVWKMCVEMHETDTLSSAKSIIFCTT